MTEPTSTREKVDDRSRFLVLICILLCCVFTPNTKHAAFVADGALLIALALAWRIRARDWLRRFAPALPVVLAFSIWLPFVPSVQPAQESILWLGLRVYPQGVQTALGIALKSTVAVGSASLLSVAVPTDRLWSCLAWMRVPSGIVTGLVVTQRSINVLLDQTARMKRGLFARGYRGRHPREIAPVGRLIGSLFVRSHERQERIHAAMRSRGFDGTVRPAPFDRPMTALSWMNAALIVSVCVVASALL